MIYKSVGFMTFISLPYGVERSKWQRILNANPNVLMQCLLSTSNNTSSMLLHVATTPKISTAPAEFKGRETRDLGAKGNI
jgi:hypothetical protein